LLFLPCAVASACAAASLNADQPSRAHFTLAGNWATPTNATASSSRSSSGSNEPIECIISVNSACNASASSTDLPITRSLMTEVDAWEIEQPTPS